MRRRAWAAVKSPWVAVVEVGTSACAAFSAFVAEVGAEASACTACVAVGGAGTSSCAAARVSSGACDLPGTLGDG